MRLWATIVGLFFLTATALLQPSAFAADGNRVALVIGNSNYIHAPTLANPVSDAHLMAEVLRKAKFNVIEGIDLDYAAMHDRLNRFTEASYDADLAIIYYAGHGLQVDSKNYLVPVDAELTAPAHLKTRAIQVDELLGALPPDPAVGVIILDACRDNPLARTLAASLPTGRSVTAPGLAPIGIATTEAGSGRVLIAYATEPGTVCDDGNDANSPYATALARHLTEPGAEIQSALTRVQSDVMAKTNGRQRPWQNASLGRKIFVGSAPATTATPAPQVSTLGSAAPSATPGADSRGWEIEQRVWDEASKRNTIAHYEAYLQQFPNGAFANLARLNIDQLKSPAAASAESDALSAAAASKSATATATPENDAGTELTESAIGLDRKGKIDVQERLLAIGYDVDNADGNFGAATRRAIGLWQKEDNLPPTTFLTRKQYLRLKLDTDAAVQSFRTQRASEAAKELQGATPQEAGKTEPVVGAKPTHEQQREAARPRPAARSKAASAMHARSARKPRFRDCSGVDGTFQVPGSQRCPLSGYAHY